jgi:hypothetical protein
MESTTECRELNNIKYKSMLLTGAALQETPSTNNMDNLDKFLENEKNYNVTEAWCKLNKTLKTQKLQEYVELCKIKLDLTKEEGETLFVFLKDCVDRKKLYRVKDVIYDKETCTIKDIPALCYIKETKHFTLKNIDKRVSTLKSLTPKKPVNGTIRKKSTVKPLVTVEEAV